MRILVFGKNGQVARCLQQEAPDGIDLTSLSSTDTDLRQPGAATLAIESHKPDIIINASAYTAVDRAEEETTTAARLNEKAVEEMAIAAKTCGAHFIHISTDYVFDGNSDDHYRETDATNPLNVYGKTKLDGELAALKENDQTIILRTSWVFSEFGANFVKTMLRLARDRDALTIVADQVGGPTPARDIARSIWTIAQKKQRGAPGQGIYHYQGAPTVSWADFAEEIFSSAKKTVKVTAIPTSEYPTPAQRPLQTILDCARIERDFGIAQPDWRIALGQIVMTLKKEDDQS